MIKQPIKQLINWSSNQSSNQIDSVLCLASAAWEPKWPNFLTQGVFVVQNWRHKILENLKKNCEIFLIIECEKFVHSEAKLKNLGWLQETPGQFFFLGKFGQFSSGMQIINASACIGKFLGQYRNSKPKILSKFLPMDMIEQCSLSLLEVCWSEWNK